MYNYSGGALGTEAAVSEAREGSSTGMCLSAWGVLRVGVVFSADWKTVVLSSEDIGE